MKPVMKILAYALLIFSMINGPIADLFLDKGDYAQATFDLLLAIWVLEGSRE